MPKSTMPTDASHSAVTGTESPPVASFALASASAVRRQWIARVLPLAGLAGLVVYTVLAGDRFMTLSKWANLVQQASVVSIIGFG